MTKILSRSNTVEVERLKKEKKELVEALERLARLGNGDRYGNSDGNVIAQEALSRSEERKEG